MDRNSPDPDVRFGRKTSKQGFYGYQSHLVQEADSQLIVPVLTTPGNVPDGVVLPTLAQPQARELTGDKAYDSKVNRSHLAALGVSSTKENPGNNFLQLYLFTLKNCLCR